MKKKFLNICLSFITIFQCYGFESYESEIQDFKDFVNFYDNEKHCIEYEGHLWRPVFMYHLETCPCNFE